MDRLAHGKKWHGWVWADPSMTESYPSKNTTLKFCSFKEQVSGWGLALHMWLVSLLLLLCVSEDTPGRSPPTALQLNMTAMVTVCETRTHAFIVRGKKRKWQRKRRNLQSQSGHLPHKQVFDSFQHLMFVIIVIFLKCMTISVLQPPDVVITDMNSNVAFY